MKITPRSSRFVGLLAFAWVLFPFSSMAQPQFSVVEIEAPAGIDLNAGGINDLGQIAGSFRGTSSSVIGNRIFRPFVWLPEAAAGFPAGFHNLGALGEGRGTVTGLNGSLEMSGWGETTKFDQNGFQVSQGFRWQNGAFEIVGNIASGYSHSQALGINAAGEMVALERNVFGCLPMIWLPKPAYGFPAGLSALPPAAGFFEAAAVGINDQGQVVGYSTNACDTTSSHATLWLPEPAYGLPAGTHDLTPDIPVTGGFEAQKINNNGVVIGDFYGEFPVIIGAWRWSNGSLDILEPLVPDTNFVFPGGLNDHGAIVGSSGSRAVLWKEDEVYALDDLIPADSGWVLQAASDINNQGQIVGEGIFNGENATFRLDPLPMPDGFEPSDPGSLKPVLGTSLREGLR